MTLGIRGANPIWAEFDLSGKIFDDNYYMWVLQNTVPYIPGLVYHDPDLQDVWEQPIQFLANGTLPVDIYFVPDSVYRLEFRQSSGLAPPSQDDPLIYLVENYVAGEGGSTPIDTISFASSNQVTNPQFALINFGIPGAPSPTYTFTGAFGSPLQIAPGWFFVAEGSGTVTFTRIALNDSNKNPSNAPYALEINVSGWDAGTVFLVQRFQQNGMLWARKFVTSTVTTRVQGPINTISAILVDSNNTNLGFVLPANTTVDSEFRERKGHLLLQETTNPDIPPSAWIDYKLALPSSIDIFVTSIQLVVQDTEVEPSFDQDSINRQIDHTYNTAYPIVPIGTVIDFAGFVIPAHYFLCDGTTKSRTDYNLLFRAITTTQIVSLNSTTTFTAVPSAADLYIGMKIEGTGIPATTTITNISGTTITISLAATITGTSTIRYFAYGNGDGTTTFTLPDLRDYVIAGEGGSLFGAANNGVGKLGGSATHTLLPEELPPHTHTYLAHNSNNVAQAGGFSGFTANTNQETQPGPGTSTPFSIVQQTALMKKCIRFE